MKITLDLDPSALSTEVSEFIKNLTAEDKQAMVKQVVTEYYTDYKKFEAGEKAVKENEIVEQMKKSDWGDYEKRNYGSTDEDIRKHYKFKEKMDKVKTFSQTTREEISNQIRGELSSQIKKFIDTDEEYKALLKESMEAVKERFPLMVQQAMIAHFTQQIPNLTNEIYNAMTNINNRLSNVEQKLLR